MKYREFPYDRSAYLNLLDTLKLEVEQLVSSKQIPSAMEASFGLVSRVFDHQNWSLSEDDYGVIRRTHVRLLNDLFDLWSPLIDNRSLNNWETAKLYRIFLHELRCHMTAYDEDLYSFLHPICGRLAAQSDKIDDFVLLSVDLIKCCGEIHASHHMHLCFRLLYEAGRKEDAMALLQHDRAGTDGLRVLAAESLLNEYKDQDRLSQVMML